MSKPDWLDLFLPFIPFSLAGAFFGDSIRKDALTKQQRVAAGLFSLAMGPLTGLIVIREVGFSDFTGLAVAAVVPTLAYDAVGVLVSFLRWLKDNPGTIRDLWPWGRK
jgi:hypothetical protein